MVRYLSRHTYIHTCAHADPYTHKYKYVFLSFMSFLLKRARASDVSDRPDITRARRRRINTRYVHSCSLFLSLSLSPSPHPPHFGGFIFVSLFVSSFPRSSRHELDVGLSHFVFSAAAGFMDPFDLARLT